MTFKNMFKGCPGLQFKLDNGWLLALVLICVFLFCGVVYTAGPVLWGFLSGFAVAGQFVHHLALACGIKRRSRPCWCKFIIVIICFFLFLIVFALCEAIFLTIGAIVGALAGAILTIPTMFYTIFFGVRLICLRCKRLK